MYEFIKREEQLLDYTSYQEDFIKEFGCSIDINYYYYNEDNKYGFINVRLTSYNKINYIPFVYKGVKINYDL